MKRHFFLFAAFFTAATFPAKATLIGDTMTVNLESSLGTYFTTNIVGQTGTGDHTALGSLPLVADAEGSNFNVYNISTVPTVLFPNIGSFNGLVVTGINEFINSILVTTTLVGWDDSRLTFDGHSFSADFRELEFPPTDGLADVKVCLWCVTINPTPDAGSSASLVALGLLGLAAISRRIGKKH
jgi:hypothetical protein